MYNDCVSVALVIQDPMRMRRIILSSVACTPVIGFYTLIHKRHDYRKKGIEHKYMFCSSLKLLSETFSAILR